MLHMMRTHTIVGHILGTNVDIYTKAFVTYDTLKNKLVTLLEQMENTHILQDSFRFGHTHRLYMSASNEFRPIHEPRAP